MIAVGVQATRIRKVLSEHRPQVARMDFDWGRPYENWVIRTIALSYRRT
jgi:hypothetical protein